MQFQQTLMSLTKRNQGFNRNIHTRSSFFDGHPNFLHLNFPTPKLWLPPSPDSLKQVQKMHDPNIVSCNPPQYESHHHKQHLLITTSKISHCLPQPQFIKTKHFQSQISLRPRIPHSPHIPNSKSYPFQKLAEDLQRTFPSLRPEKKILNPPSYTQSLHSLDLHQKQKHGKITSYTDPASKSLN